MPIPTRVGQKAQDEHLGSPVAHFTLDVQGPGRLVFVHYRPDPPEPDTRNHTHLLRATRTDLVLSATCAFVAHKRH